MTYNKELFKKRFFEKYNPDEHGIWEIYGEDPNCDFGGHHHNPFLGVVEGFAKDVVEYAMDLRGFWQWGSGGYLKKRTETVKKITPGYNQRKNELLRQKADLDKKLRAIEGYEIPYGDSIHLTYPLKDVERLIGERTDKEVIGFLETLYQSDESSGLFYSTRGPCKFFVKKIE